MKKNKYLSKKNEHNTQNSINCACSVFLASVLPGVKVENYISAITVALVIGLLNIFVRPIIVLLTLPATIITLGLFLFVINAGIILLADKFVDGFKVAGFFEAFFFSVLLSLLRSFLLSFVKEKPNRYQR